jgi:hypothetical protein
VLLSSLLIIALGEISVTAADDGEDFNELSFSMFLFTTSACFIDTNNFVESIN